MATDLTPVRATGRRPLQAASRHEARLLADARFLERALAVPTYDPDWRSQVSVRLGGLARSFAEHVFATEGPQGFYAELLDHAPRLARCVHVLVREHAAVTETLAALRHRIDLPEVGVDELRSRSAVLLRELARHRQRGADLVYEAYETDIGGED